jgi:hypothetical protein
MSAKELEQFETTIAPIREKYRGRIAVFEDGEGGVIVVAKPDNTRAYKDLFDQINSTEFSTADAYEGFALECIKYPERAAAERLLKEYPAIANLVTRKGREFCGESVRELGKA